MRNKFKGRRDLMVELLRKIPDISCSVPGGAFYVFPDFSHYLNKSANGHILHDSFALCDYILDSAEVVTVPGDGFGAPGHIRFSCATKKDTIREGIDRVGKVLNDLN
jgi:aspartate aminotransferase